MECIDELLVEQFQATLRRLANLQARSKEANHAENDAGSESKDERSKHAKCQSACQVEQDPL